MLALLPDDPRERLVVILSVASGMLQFAGYALGITYAVLGRTRPHPLTWLMFAYGTLLIFLLELVHGVEPELLILPAVCFSSSLLMVAVIWFRGGYEIRPDQSDLFVFGFDVALTILWLAVYALMELGAIPAELFQIMNVVIIMLWCCGVYTSFAPMIRDTRAHPDHERSSPWLTWTAAYGTLLAATVVQYWNVEEGRMEGFEFLLYPVVNLYYHLKVGVLALNRNVAPKVASVIEASKPVPPLKPKTRS